MRSPANQQTCLRTAWGGAVTTQRAKWQAWRKQRAECKRLVTQTYGAQHSEGRRAANVLLTSTCKWRRPVDFAVVP